MWVFPKIGVGPQNGCFIMENPIKMEDLGIPGIFGSTRISNHNHYHPEDLLTNHHFMGCTAGFCCRSSSHLPAQIFQVSLLSLPSILFAVAQAWQFSIWVQTFKLATRSGLMIPDMLLRGREIFCAARVILRDFAYVEPLYARCVRSKICSDQLHGKRSSFLSHTVVFRNNFMGFNY